MLLHTLTGAQAVQLTDSREILEFMRATHLSVTARINLDSFQPEMKKDF